METPKYHEILPTIVDIAERVKDVGVAAGVWVLNKVVDLDGAFDDFQTAPFETPVEQPAEPWTRRLTTEDPKHYYTDQDYPPNELSPQ